MHISRSRVTFKLIAKMLDKTVLELLVIEY